MSIPYAMNPMGNAKTDRWANYDYVWTVNIPSDSLEYNFRAYSNGFTIDWGDGTTSQAQGGDKWNAHTYSQGGVYLIKTYNSSNVTFFCLGLTTNVSKVVEFNKIGLLADGSISSHLCNGAINLTSVNIPKNTTKIGDRAFQSCARLENLTLPNSITVIDDSSFAECSLLDIQKLPTSLKTLNNNAFIRTSVSFGILPDTLEIIGTAALEITNITANVIPASVKTIGMYAFYFVPLVNSIRFNGTPTSIGDGAFSGNRQLLNIYVPWAEGEVAGAPWGATNATIHYNWTPTN